MTKITAWIKAFRLRTLPLSISGIMVGSFLAMKDGAWDTLIFWLAMITTLLFQILSNLANDLGDTLKGADNADRVGPKRSVQSGAITISEMKKAVLLFAILGLLSSGGLIGYCLDKMPSGVIVTYAILALLCVLAAITYTLGKKAYGYLGLGDVFVFIFFGGVSVLGVYGLFTYTVTLEGALLAITFGLLSTAVLNLNNMRDVVNDETVGKRTLVVKLGFDKAKVYHLLLLAIAFFCLLYFALLQQEWFYLITILPFGILFKHLIGVIKTTEPASLDPELKKVALSTFIIAVIFMFITLIQ